MLPLFALAFWVNHLTERLRLLVTLQALCACSLIQKEINLSRLKTRDIRMKPMLTICFGEIAGAPGCSSRPMNLSDSSIFRRRPFGRRHFFVKLRRPRPLPKSPENKEGFSLDITRTLERRSKFGFHPKHACATCTSLGLQAPAKARFSLI